MIRNSSIFVALMNCRTMEFCATVLFFVMDVVYFFTVVQFFKEILTACCDCIFNWTLNSRKLNAINILNLNKWTCIQAHLEKIVIYSFHLNFSTIFKLFTPTTPFTLVDSGLFWYTASILTRVKSAVSL